MTSAVWKYFVIDPERQGGLYAKCNICSKLISRGASKSTSNLNKHLISVHRINIKTNESTPSKMLKQDNTLITTEGTLKQFFSTEIKSTKPLHEIIDKSCSPGFHSVPSTSQSVGITSKESSATIPSTSSAALSTGFDISIHESYDSFPQHQLPNIELQDMTTNLYPKVIKRGKRKGQQPTLLQVCDKTNKFTYNDPRSLKITNLIAQMICLDLQPFSIVENKGFRNLIMQLEPRYTMPSRKILGNKIIPEMYSAVNESLKEDVKGAQYVALTTDMWTSISGNDYMALTCHFYYNNIDKLELVHKCLEVVPFKEVSHTAMNLANFIEDLISDWELTEKVVAVVRDNGRDIKAAIALSQFSDISCTAHSLQLVVKDGFLNNPKINNLTAKCRKVVGSFKHSTKNTKVLRRCQKQLGLPEHRLVQDEPTRWNSTFHMLQRLNEQKGAIIMSSASVDINISTELSNDDWKTMEAAVKILEIFDVATLQLSKESSTISEIIPLIKLITYQLETPAPPGSGLQGMKNDLLSSIKIRFSNIEANNLMGPATLLDPRFKDKAFSTALNVAMAKEIILAEMEEYEVDIKKKGLKQPTASPGKGIWSRYSTIFSISSSSTISSHNKKEELAKYLAECCLSPESDAAEVRQYWCQSQHMRLKRLVIKYLCVPPATVFSERLFSTAGNIVDTKRNRLDPERVKMLVFLNKNLK